MALPHDLLEQAAHLAKREPKRPKQASLRRAISAGYYAVFHLLVSDGIRYWKIERQRAVLARVFDHGSMKQACSRPQLEPRLKEVADAFVELQQARHSADYDYSKVFTRVEALAHIETAKNAFQKWKTVRNEDFAQDFLLSLLTKQRH